MFGQPFPSSSKPLSLDLNQSTKRNNTLDTSLFGASSSLDNKPLFSPIPANHGVQSQQLQPQPEITTRNGLSDNSPTIVLFPNRSGTSSRTSVAPSFFLGSHQHSQHQAHDAPTMTFNNNNNIASVHTLGNEKRETLPGFLSESCNPKAGQKRSMNGSEERRVLLKTTEREKGLFAQGGEGGFSMHPKKSANITTTTTTTTSLSPSSSSTAEASTSAAATTAFSGPPVQSMWDQRNLTMHTTSAAEPRAALYDSTHSREDIATTIMVFGFIRERVNEVIAHFGQFGEIEEERPSTGNWINIRYKSPFAAREALKCNGTTISDDMMIGVRMVTETSGRTGVQFINVVPFAQSKDLFKKKEDNSVQIGLGSGQAGVSVLGCKDVSERSDIEKIKDSGWMYKVKETLFGW